MGGFFKCEKENAAGSLHCQQQPVASSVSGGGGVAQLKALLPWD